MLKFVTDEEAEKMDFVVCMRKGAKTPFTDNLEGKCAHCDNDIIFRPSSPKNPSKICLECAVDLSKYKKA